MAAPANLNTQTNEGVNLEHVVSFIILVGGLPRSNSWFLRKGEREREIVSLLSMASAEQIKFGDANTLHKNRILWRDIVHILIRRDEIAVL